MRCKRLPSLWAGCVVPSLLALSSSALAQAESSSELSPRDLSLLAGALVALLTWFGGQVAIPLYKYRREQRRGRELTIAIMKVVTDKTLDFFGAHKSTPAFDKILFRIDEQIDNVRLNNNYFAHISVSEDDPFKDKVLNTEHFWLVDKELIKAFIKVEENASRANFMCKAVMDKDYLQLVRNDRNRYISALEQIREQFDVWQKSTLKLQELLKKY